MKVSVRSRVAWSLLLTAALVCGPRPSFADYPEAKRYFENLTNKERIAETLGLISTGDFQGLLDFGFTRHYFKAVTEFQKRYGFTPDGILTPSESQKLNQIADNFYDDMHVDWETLPGFTSKLLVPKGIFSSHTYTETGEAYEREDKAVSLSFDGYPNGTKDFIDLFSSLSSETPTRHVNYKKLNSDFFVINGVFHGRFFYTWMSKVPEGVTGFTIAWNDRWDDTGSKVSIFLANTFIPESSQQVSNTPPPAAAPTPTQPVPPQADGGKSVYAGTGFQITSEGYILTNNHVIEKCTNAVVKRDADTPVAATVVATDPQNDLALLKTQSPVTGTIVNFRSGPAPRAGEDIVVFGFPKIDVLSQSGNLVTGNITALAGAGDDSSQYQISAPIQHGNSGGPVADRSGHIVGVVVARMESAGDQNINFAIKAGVAENFLDTHGIAYVTSNEQKPLETPAIGDLLRTSTYLILCGN